MLPLIQRVSLSIPDMKLVIVHYHLREGGVTRVIERQIDALKKFGDISLHLLVGDSAGAGAVFRGVPLTREPALDYTGSLDPVAAKRRRSALLRAFRQFDRHTVFHIHNPVIGKNPVLNTVIGQLLREECHLLLHCHDFIHERPLLLQRAREYAAFMGCTLQELLYPAGESGRWLFTNRADMHRSELPRALENREYVPNPVAVERSLKTDRNFLAKRLGLDAEKNWYIYPVRAIGRKNIGELLLLSRVIEAGGGQWFITRAPQNSEEIPLYEQWCELAERFHLPVDFDTAERVPFAELYSSCNYAVTTSEREGFGMAFLEPFLHGIPLLGRNLPAVTEDFCAEGMVFPGLYDHLWVFWNGETVDYTALSYRERIAAAAGILDSSELCDRFLQMNPALAKLPQAAEKEVDMHRRIVQRHYSSDSFGKALYRQMLLLYTQKGSGRAKGKEDE
ncbi:MAG: glycosyltransferase [Fibrobacterota bacterium]